MTAKEIQDAYTTLMLNQKRIKINSAYAYGKNHGILTGDEKADPDNRIPIPLGKSAVIDITGYAGRPGEIKTEYVNVSGPKPEQDEITELLAQFDEHNNEGLENSELLTTSVSIGDAWELWYTSDDLDLKNAMRTPEYKIINNNECVPIYSTDIKPKLEAFLRFTDDKEKGYCDVYLPKLSERWERDKNSDTWIRDELGDTVYPYSTVPAIRFRSSMDNTPIFEAQKPIIDGLDRIVSNTQNEVDRFAGLMMLFPGKVDRKYMQKITEALRPYIDDLDEYDPAKWPQYLSKDYSGIKEFYQFQTEYLEDAFHKTIKIMDITDENFAGDQSGVAMAYKLIGIEFIISGIEIYFRLGLKQRFDFYKDILKSQTSPVSLDDYEQVITWKRNLPVDDEMKVRIAAMLMGLGLDMKTIINYLPNSIIENKTDEEIEALLITQVPLTEEGDSLDGLETVDAVKLNGAQVTAAKGIIESVSEGKLPRANGVELIISLGIPEEQAQKMVPR